MSERDDNPNGTAENWTAEDESELMARYARIAEESATAPSMDGKSVVADYSLGGSVPRAERARGRYKAKDIYIRLENTIYGPITQEELAQMLASGELTGFESASADLQHWTPLIYHPRMTLAGEIDPDATHDMLHNHSTLPAASRPVDKFDLEALGESDDDDDEIPQQPSTPLAAILIKPIKVSRKSGLPLPVHADLEEESIEKVIERTDIPVEQRVSGEQALAEIANRTSGMMARGEIEFSDEFDALAVTDVNPGPSVYESGDSPVAPDDDDATFSDINLDVDIEVSVDQDARVDSASQYELDEEETLEHRVPLMHSDALPVIFEEPPVATTSAARDVSPFVSWLVFILVIASAAVAAMTTLKSSTPEVPEAAEAAEVVVEEPVPAAGSGATP